MNLFSHILPVFAIAALCAGWVAVQVLAKRMGTKNHFDDAGSCGNGCSCGGGICEREDSFKH